MSRLNFGDWVAMILVIIGGLNWGLVGAFNFDLVATLFGVMTLTTKIVYILVGLGAVYAIFTVAKCAKA
jgi:uncharacterized membrane protein YuzA (DUF378 family)